MMMMTAMMVVNIMMYLDCFRLAEMLALEMGAAIRYGL